MEALTRGALAQQGRVNAETIRYYERRGLLPKPPRTPSGYRVFSSDAVRRVRFIKRAQGLGFSLKEIKALLALRVDPCSSCGDVRKRAEAGGGEDRRDRGPGSHAAGHEDGARAADGRLGRAPWGHPL